jgi:hypothetical protein
MPNRMKFLFAFLLLLGAMLTSAPSTEAKASRPGFGQRPSSGGFRSSSSPSYRSYSSSPSRTFSFSRSTAAPRATYTAPAPAPSSYRSSRKTVVNNHYHGGGTATGGGGLGVMDYVILDGIVNRDRSPTYINHQPVVAQSVVSSGVSAPFTESATVVYQEETHYWRNFFVFILGLGFLYGLYRLIRVAVAED